MLILFLVLAITSCTSSIQEDSMIQQLDTKSTESVNDHHVRYSDIVTLTNGESRTTTTRSSAEAVRNLIECLTNSANDTLLYVYKKQGGGWTIYSSDTRVPAIVAQGNSGSFDKLMEIDGARLWIEAALEDMSIIKRLGDDMLNFTKNEIESNKEFWKSISFPDEYVKNKLWNTTRVINPDLILTSGHYELIASTTYSEDYDSIPRMTRTDWRQGYPYNVYCPEKSSGWGCAPAGCVAIAGAQMLYFLHELLGVPQTAPSEASCDGDINSYKWSQTNYTSDIWEKMQVSGIQAAPFIADVGRRINMKYGNTESLAKVEDLVTKVFSPYGISCTFSNYDANQVINSLQNGMPVLLSAFSRYPSNAETKKDGHAFITDRYKRSRIVTQNYYVWVYDTYPPNKPIPMVKDKIEYTYSSPKISMIGMNWGWGYDYYSPDEWFSLTGDWICHNPQMSMYNWNINRKMIYYFHIK